MIKKAFPVLVAVMLVLSIVILASARGAPQKTDAVQVTATVDTPVMTAESAPSMTGYDVIQNLTVLRDVSIARNICPVVTTTAQQRLSPTVDWRSGHPPVNRHSSANRVKPSPEIVWRA